METRRRTKEENTPWYPSLKQVNKNWEQQAWYQGKGRKSQGNMGKITLA